VRVELGGTEQRSTIGDQGEVSIIQSRRWTLVKTHVLLRRW